MGCLDGMSRAVAIAAAALAVVGCGRSNFEQRSDAVTGTDVGDALPGDVPSGNANIAFVTSTTYLPITIGSDLAGADAACNTRAATAGLPGTYVAWVSSSGALARDRLAGSRGWVRTDGRPLVDRVEDLTGGNLLGPLVLDEFGQHAGYVDEVMTGAPADGGVYSNCSDFTIGSSAGSLQVGQPWAARVLWTQFRLAQCDLPKRLYCFGVGKNAPLSYAPATGRRAFVTVQTFAIDATGIAKADALCNSEAALAGLSGTYAALLATTTASAISRFSLTGPTWVRPDGVAIADSPLKLANMDLRASLNVTSLGTYTSGYVFTGASTPTAVSPSLAASCGDWTSTSTTAIAGEAADTGNGIMYSNSTAPCVPRPIYCLEQ